MRFDRLLNESDVRGGRSCLPPLAASGLSGILLQPIESSKLTASHSHPHPRASGYPSVPGIWTQEQVEGWKPVTAAVHQLGSTFFCQLWHVGRASAPCYQPDGGLPLAPSVLPIPPEWEYFDTKLGKPQKYPLPRELAAEELPGIVEQYRVAARNAIAAGFDGVEIHAANGEPGCGG